MDYLSCYLIQLLHDWCSRVGVMDMWQELSFVPVVLSFVVAIHCGYTQFRGSCSMFSLRLYYVFIAAILRPTNYYMETSNLCKVELGCDKFNNKKIT